MTINDFGEKIGGAKKDLWRDRGLILDDLVYMNDAERKKLITKDNVWKKPNYQELVDKGLPVRVVYFMKMIRDATPVRPEILYSYTKEEIKEVQERYIKFVSVLGNNVMNLTTENDILNFYSDFMKLYLIPNEKSAFVSVAPDAKGCIDNKMLKASQVRNFRVIDSEIKKKQFCYTPKEKILSQYRIICFDGERVKFEKDYSNRDILAIKENFIKTFIYLKEEFANQLDWKVNSFFIESNRQIIANNFETKEAAEKYILDNHVEKENEGKQRKKRFTPKQLENIIRNGEDYRKGKNISGDDMLNEFGFKGGEFGNWLNELDRQHSLNYCYDALKDLSIALKISEKDISLGNSLSIAFGARGEGNALAHYEEDRNVINLTKMKGAGSLAHEWGHALDHALGKLTGTDEFITEFRGYYRNDELKIINDLMETMKYKTVCNSETLVMQINKHEKNIELLKKNVDALLPNEKLNNEQIELKAKVVCEMINNAECREFKISTSFEPNTINDSIEELSKLRRDSIGTAMLIEQKENLLYKQNNIHLSKEKIGKPERIETDFYKNSKEFDSMYAKTDKRYWQSDSELFARAFACYVQDKLNYKSDYLCGHAELAIGFTVNKDSELELIKAFPEGKEREEINSCMDKVIEFAKEKNILHERCNEMKEIESNEEILEY